MNFLQALEKKYKCKVIDHSFKEKLGYDLLLSCNIASFFKVKCYYFLEDECLLANYGSAIYFFKKAVFIARNKKEISNISSKIYVESLKNNEKFFLTRKEHVLKHYIKIDNHEFLKSNSPRLKKVLLWNVHCFDGDFNRLKLEHETF